MKDYASMSDGKIAEQVAKFVELGDRKQKGEWALYVKNNVWTRFDPCNNPADAWPIIVDNLIALKPVEKYVGGYRWFAVKGDGDFSIKCADENPLRCAMIVFLMMKEGE